MFIEFALKYSKNDIKLYIALKQVNSHLSLQVTGLGTALKILFSGKFDQQLSLSAVRETKFQLSREEIVALFNAFGR